MANLCQVCGQPCGWWRTVHRECEPQKEAIDHVRFAEHRREEQAAEAEYPIVVEELGRRLGEHSRPMETTPTLFSFNGIGTRMYGRARYDEVTDSYVATQWFCLFWIPIAPLARYRVVRRSGRGWAFIAQVMDDLP